MRVPAQVTATAKVPRVTATARTKAGSRSSRAPIATSQAVAAAASQPACRRGSTRPAKRSMSSMAPMRNPMDIPSPGGVRQAAKATTATSATDMARRTWGVRQRRRRSASAAAPRSRWPALTAAAIQ